MADQVTLADVVIAQPIQQFRGEAVEISDPESENKEKESEDPEIVALFDNGFFQLPTQVRRQKIKEFRKAIGAQPCRPQEERGDDIEENIPPQRTVT